MLVFSTLLPLAVLPQLAAAYPHRLSSVSPRDDSDNGDFRKVQPAPEINSEQYRSLTNTLPEILKLARGASHQSWEAGTLTEALLEVYNPSLTPFDWNANALGKPDNKPEKVLEIVDEQLRDYFSGDQGNDGQQQGNDGQQPNDGQQQGNDGQQPNDEQQGDSNDQTGQWWDEPHDEAAKKRAETDETDTKATDGANTKVTNNFEKYFQSKENLSPRPLVWAKGSLADPASLGMATWVMANYADNRGGPSGDDYRRAVANQLEYLMVRPNKQDGCISHRDYPEPFESWSDSGYMIPPFLAYLGLATKDDELLMEAIKQWNLEADLLFDENNKLFKHKTNDGTLWATGNGWMLMGLARVIASITHADNKNLDGEINKAKDKAKDVFNACLGQLVEGRIPNRMNSDDRRADSTGTAFVVAAYYRFRQVSPEVVAGGNLDQLASEAFDAVVKDIGADNWLINVVNPSGYNNFMFDPDPDQPRIYSAEGQAGLILMWAARTAAGV